MKMQTLRNLKIICSWHGQNYSGYQIQPNAKTIEQVLTDSWETLTKHPEKITGCSRLDAGVHAKQYVFNIQTKTKLSPDKIVKALNGILQSKKAFDICIYSCEDIDESFHARFSATGKHYRYLLWHGTGEHVFYREYAWHIKTKSDLKNLSKILKIFEGKHDFNSFRATDCTAKTTIRTIYKIDVKQHEEYPELCIIDIYGNGFLKNMVRNLVGAAMLVLKEKRSLDDMKSRLNTGKKDYNLCAPSHALTLMEVYYLPIQKLEKMFS